MTCPVLSSQDASIFGELIISAEASQVLLLMDHNTQKFCEHQVKELFPTLSMTSFSIVPGEASKSLEIAETIWDLMLTQNFDRQSIIINLGGGVVSDLGGMVASMYKRGVKYYNIPTSLLAMVDASIGGKTAVNLNQFKNQIGSFYQPSGIYIQPSFLNSLPNLEIKNGKSELFKTLLLEGAELVNNWIQLSPEEQISDTFIYNCANFKSQIINEDFRDQGKRIFLNLGHTVGHALESVFANKPLPHGQAVALGLYYEHAYFGMYEVADLCLKFIKQEFPDLIGMKVCDKQALSLAIMKDKKSKTSVIHIPIINDSYQWETRSLHDIPSLSEYIISHWLSV